MSQIKSCLIIDDDPDDQEIFLMCVKKLHNDIHCKTSNSGVDAISLLNSDEEFTPDYIFLDVNMPRMSGLVCLQEIRKIEKLKGTKIYMYSTTTEAKMVEESKKFGAADFIIKPTKTSELKELLSGIFQSTLK